jgi:hypothetical protein
MKKLLIAIASIICLASIANAQVKKQTKNAKPATAAAAPVKTKPVVAATSATAPLKKDGTPDKRFKENKATAGPTKKDGTPDMRFKANKDAAAKKKPK